jgi:uncharacterized protein YdaU (DUF1376 family)
MANVDSYLPLFGRDFLAATMGWTAEERGHYIVLLITQWEQGSVPTDPERLEMISPGVARCWGTLSTKFPAGKDGAMRNIRLEEHRAKATALAKGRAEKAARAAQARWGRDAPSIAQASPKHRTITDTRAVSQNGASANVAKNGSSDAPSMRQALLEQCPPSPSPSPNKKQSNSSSQSAQMPVFPCDSGTWAPTQEMVAEWIETYPSLDVMAQLRRARQWCIDNVDRRKTKRGMRGFIGRWLANVKAEPKPASQSKKVLASLED